MRADPERKITMTNPEIPHFSRHDKESEIFNAIEET